MFNEKIFHNSYPWRDNLSFFSVFQSFLKLVRLFLLYIFLQIYMLKKSTHKPVYVDTLFTQNEWKNTLTRISRVERLLFLRIISRVGKCFKSVHQINEQLSVYLVFKTAGTKSSFQSYFFLFFFFVCLLQNLFVCSWFSFVQISHFLKNTRKNILDIETNVFVFSHPFH